MFFINFARKLATMKKKTYIKGFFTVVAVLALTRIIWPEVAVQRSEERGVRIARARILLSSVISLLTPHFPLLIQNTPSIACRHSKQHFLTTTTCKWRRQRGMAFHQ